MNIRVYLSAVLVESPRDFMGRFLEGVDDPEARIVRGARVASLGLFTGGLTAIPVNLMVVGLNPVMHLLELGIVALAVACLRTQWEGRDPRTLYMVAIVATVFTAAASIVSTYAFAINYIFIVLAVAVAAPFRVMLGTLAAVMIALFAPAAVGASIDTSALPFALIGGPTLVVTALIAHELTRKLERSREAFWAMSREDDLTGLGNYRALVGRMAEEISRHGRHHRNLTVILLDLDQFKAVNDTHGHLEGDRVLRAVAGAIADSIRSEDTAYRQGGDEFAIIAPETSIEELDPIIDRLSLAVGTCSPGNAPLTIGTGASMYPDDGLTADELIRVADERLMEPKRARDESAGVVA